MKEKGVFGKVESLVWFRCNCNCLFCSFGDHIERAKEEAHHGIKTAGQIKEDIDYAKSINASAFAFSGGEPTIRPDIIELIRYARQKNFDRIEIQSNGRLFYYKEFCKKIIDAGVTEFVISFHSNIEKIQDRLMGVKGSYKQALQGIKNLKNLGQKVKINILINKMNYKHLPELVSFLLDLSIDEIRFDFVTVEGNAMKNADLIVPKMSDTLPYLYKSLDIALKKVQAFVYNIPLCLMRDYEDAVVEIRQADTQLRGPDFNISIDENRHKFKAKTARCSNCIKNDICQGVWKNYLALYGDNELKPLK